MLKSLIVAFSTICWLTCSAGEMPPISQTEIQTLAKHPEWLKLGHYQRTLTGWRSAIHSPEFFLASTGQHDPEAELRATLQAFIHPADAPPDDQPRCRFPARWLWLHSQVNLESGIAGRDADCPGFRDWTRDGKVKSLSVVLATGYLGNPASYYGHTLLKFNFSEDTGQTRLMDVSVNYGAINSQHDNAVVYIFKSVAGGYDGGFSHIHFYYHDHNYGDVELRDLWEYELDLPREDVNLIVAHAWEVLGKHYTYHFFRENCALRMLELLQIGDGVEVTPDHWPWIIPQALVQKIGEATVRGHSLLKQVNYFPSRQSRFYNRYLDLDAPQQSVFRDIVFGTADFDSASFAQLPVTSRQKVTDALLDYYQFTGAPMERAPKDTRQRYAAALAKRFELPAGVPAVPEHIPTAPHLSRALGWIQVGAMHRNHDGNSSFLRIRPAYYDALDSESGQVRNASLIMGDTTLVKNENSIYLQRLEVVGVESANPGLTGLPGDRRSAWKVHLAVEQQRPSCPHCTVGRLDGDMGYGAELFPGAFGALYAGGAVQNSRDNYGWGYAKLSGSLIYRTERAALQINYEWRKPFNSSTGSYGFIRTEGRLRLGKAHDLRLRYEHDRSDQLGIGLGWYW